jgi:stage II sporulation protein B
MNKARLTYRFDGRPPYRTEKPLDPDNKVIPLREGEFEVIEEETENTQPITYDYGSWTSPFDSETERIERLIRESDARRTAHPPARNPLHDWQESREDELRRPVREESRFDEEVGQADWDDRRPLWNEESPGPRYVRRSKMHGLKIAASVAAAVGTGALLGFLALSLFSGHAPIDTGGAAGGKTGAVIDQGLKAGTGSDEKTPSDPQGASLKTLGTAEGAKVPTTDTGTGAAAGYVTADIPAKHYFVLQNGGFGSKGAAEAAQRALKQAGIESALELPAIRRAPSSWGASCRTKRSRSISRAMIFRRSAGSSGAERQQGSAITWTAAIV